MSTTPGVLAASMAMTFSTAGIAAPVVAPFGSWASPIAAADLAKSAVNISDVRVFNGRVYWRESRPTEAGRQVLVTLGADGAPKVLTPANFSVRTRVHEYGGSSYWVLDDVLVFVNFQDQRLYLQRGEAAPVAITPEHYQYSDCAIDAARNALICVREDHTEVARKAHGEERNEIVRVPLPSAPGALDAGHVLVTGTDFVAYPRLSRDGKTLAWIEWNHPSMPWEVTTLKTAPLDARGELGEHTVVAGGDRSVLEPQWGADGTLYYIDEVSGWWNLHATRDGKARALAPMAREFGGPLWSLGTQTYVLDDDGHAFARTSHEAVDELVQIDLKDGSHRRIDVPFVAFSDLSLDSKGRIITTASAAADEPALAAIDPNSGAVQRLYQAKERGVAENLISVGQRIRFPTAAGSNGEARFAHATYYPPTNPAFAGPAGQKPPLIVTIHGGPTAVSKPTFSLTRQYWTSRGFAVVDVNYGGSTSYGRDYRKRLNGQWGVVDLQDAVAAVDYLVAEGKADPALVAIRGGSAGGFTTLAALAFTDRFKAGANYYGVSDLAGLAATSHKFERKYDVSLVGPMDDARYRARSPIFHLEGFKEPLITFQGDEDRVVTPDQSRKIVAALDERGVMHAYLEFAGEQHGFRKAENIIRAQEAELAFYGLVFGFTPADAIAPFEVRHPKTPAAPM
jgi:dipeptidyl aminopeptidase/acylaminoacyl peptidase